MSAFCALVAPRHAPPIGCDYVRKTFLTCFRWNGAGEYLGPAVLLQAYRWISDSRDVNRMERLRSLSENHLKVTLLFCRGFCRRIC